MPETWVVVADSACARIFGAADNDRTLTLIGELEHPPSRAHERDLGTDTPGRTFDREGPGRHAMSQRVSPKEHESWKLCRELASFIETARARGEFDALIIAAAPTFLGELRKTLSDATARTVRCELNKRLMHLKPEDLVRYLPENAWASGCIPTETPNLNGGTT